MGLIGSTIPSFAYCAHRKSPKEHRDICRTKVSRSREIQGCSLAAPASALSHSTSFCNHCHHFRQAMACLSALFAYTVILCPYSAACKLQFGCTKSHLSSVQVLSSAAVPNETRFADLSFGIHLRSPTFNSTTSLSPHGSGTTIRP